jgi:hypothetical protein
MTAWAVAVALTAALVLTNCGGDDNGDNDNKNDVHPKLTNGNFGETLAISGKQVYTVKSTYTETGGTQRTYTPYSGTALTVSTGYQENGNVIIQDAVGSISETGKLNLTINGVPAGLVTTPITEVFDEFRASLYRNFTISARDTECVILEYLYINYGEQLEKLSRVNKNESLNEALQEGIIYIYVNHDVRITGQGIATSVTGYPASTTNIDLQFKKGWNALYARLLATFNNATDQLIDQKSSQYVGDSSDIPWSFWARDDD